MFVNENYNSILQEKSISFQVRFLLLTEELSMNNVYRFLWIPMRKWRISSNLLTLLLSEFKLKANPVKPICAFFARNADSRVVLMK